MVFQSAMVDDKFVGAGVMFLRGLMETLFWMAFCRVWFGWKNSFWKILQSRWSLQPYFAVFGHDDMQNRCFFWWCFTSSDVKWTCSETTQATRRTCGDLDDFGRLRSVSRCVLDLPWGSFEFVYSKLLCVFSQLGDSCFTGKISASFTWCNWWCWCHRCFYLIPWRRALVTGISTPNDCSAPNSLFFPVHRRWLDSGMIFSSLTHSIAEANLFRICLICSISMVWPLKTYAFVFSHDFGFVRFVWDQLIEGRTARDTYHSSYQTKKPRPDAWTQDRGPI